ncbi:MAG TPA: PAS domain S-box protein [Pyrinomonadaceae bacterium]|nr:PAS domain S-box protein [Pyrinomonadaceae bacterium]
MPIELRKTGISVVGDAPWGTHFCHFYETKQDLLDTVIPYFKAGLENKEFCLWVISDSDLITVEEAKAALREAVSDLDRYLAAGRIEIVSHDEWFLRGGAFDFHKVAYGFKEKLDEALANGYAGLRINGSPAWIKTVDANVLREFEGEADHFFANENIIASCTYPLGESRADFLLDVARTHQFVIARRQGKWDILETPQLLRAKQEIQRLNDELEQRVSERTEDLAAANEELRREIAERKHGEEKIRRQKEILQQIFDHIPVMINFVGADGRIELVNREWERTLGWSLEEIRRQNLDIFAQCYPDPHYRQQVLKFVAQAEGEWADFKTLVRNGRVLDTTWVRVQLSDGTSIGIGQDITARKQAEESLNERLGFETLVTELSAAFANLSPNEVDREIDRSLQTLVEFLNVDRASFLQFAEDSTTLYRSHSYTVPGIEPLPPAPFELKDQFPWITDQMRRGITVKWARIPDDMAEEAVKEKEYAASLGVKSGLNIPVLVGGSVICAITFTSTATYRDWPDAMVARLRLVGEIFAAAVERKRAEALLHAKEQEFRAIVENAPDQIIRYDREFRRTYVNPAVARAYGLPAEALMGKPIGSGLPEAGLEVKKDELAQVRQRIADVFNTGKTFDYELAWTMPTGRRDFSIRLFPEVDLNGSVVNVLGISRDITERKEAEEALKQSESQLTEAQRLAHVGSWDWDIPSNAVTWSDELYRIFGLEPGRIKVGGDAMAFIHPEDRDLVQSTVTNAVKNKEPYSFFYRILRPDGDERIVHSRGHVLSNERGKPVGVFGATQDITELKRAEEKLKANSEQLRALSGRLQSVREEEATRIAREIHDELGSALTRLKWDLELLSKERLRSQERVDRENSGQKIDEMIQLVDATVDTVRRISSELRPSILDDLGLAAALRWHTEQFQNRTGIVTDCDCVVENLGLNQAQSTAVFRIFEEALTNVMRHAGATKVYVRLEKDKGALVLTVRDNGRGITEAEQLDPSSLGLLGMRERVSLIGGEISITGIAGEGTLVTVRLPISEKH